MKIIALSMLVISFLWIQTAHGADDFSKEVVKSTPITATLYMLEGAGGNITASIGPDGVFLVDDDFAPMAPKIVAKLKELKGDTPRFIVNTHFHYDHTGGNKIFGSTATIIAATAVRERLATEQALWKEHHPPYPKQALPTLTFAKDLVLHFNSDQINLVHLNRGHTDGDTVVFFMQDNVVSMGDLYFAGMYPIFHPEHQGSLDGYIQNLSEIIKQIPDDCKIVPGHGPLSTKSELIRYYNMILASVSTVKNGIKAGHTLEKIQKTGLDSQWEAFSHGYLATEKWLELIYKSLKNK